jgi:hypothetical protein
MMNEGRRRRTTTTTTTTTSDGFLFVRGVAEGWRGAIKGV